MERLQKVIANSGYCSRRKAEELIVQGKVYVDGVKVTELGTKVNEEQIIVVDGVILNKNTKKVYYLLYKPSGYICSLKDEHGRKVVTDLIDTKERIYPVGRLDYDTTGLLLLTNDGEFANILMHPSNNVEKVYRATIDTILTTEEIYALKDGLVIDGIKVIPSRVEIKKKNVAKNTSIVELGIVEGRNHIVKRLFESMNHKVIKLKREKYAFLDLEGMQAGSYRTLTINEVKKLYNLKKSL